MSSYLGTYPSVQLFSRNEESTEIMFAGVTNPVIRIDRFDNGDIL
jgi:hypothetical protein